MASRVRVAFAAGLLLVFVSSVAAQLTAEPDGSGQEAQPPHDHAAMMAAQQKRWQVRDGVLFATVNHQRLAADFFSGSGMDLAIGGDATVYRLPPRLKVTHGEQPVSAHVFFRIRPLRSASGDSMEHQQ